MVFGPPTSLQKYAIVGFAPMQVVAVYDVGKDQAGAIGGSYTCTANYTFASNGSTLNLESDSLASTGGSDCSHVGRNSIANLQITSTAGGKKTTYSSPSNYTLSPNGTVVTWKNPVPATVSVAFDYRNGGACPGHAPDPNAFCLQLAWGGPAILGEGPSTGYGPAMTVQLIK
jgi:hypothetical protein